MSSLCEKLLSGCISADCENPLYAGVGALGLLMNYSDVANITYDENNGNIINGFTMKTTGENQTACAYTVQQLGNQPFSGSNTALVAGTYGNRFTNTIQLAIVDNGPEISHDVIDSLANGKFIAILVNDYKHNNGDNKYQVYGAAKGLKCTAITREFYGDNEGAYVVTLTEENAPKSGVFFYSTDEETTDTAFEALKCTCN